MIDLYHLIANGMKPHDPWVLAKSPNGHDEKEL